MAEGVTYFPAKHFKWEQVSKNFVKSGLLKVKEGPKKSWEKRFTVLYFNYLVFFKSSKEPKPKDVASGSFELEKVQDEKQVQVFSDPKEKDVFSITSSDKIVYLSAENPSDLQAWMNTLSLQIQKLSTLEPREVPEKVEKKLADVRKIFRENSTVAPSSVSPDEAEKWITDIANMRREYNRFSPFLKALGMCAEYAGDEEHKTYEGSGNLATKTYIKWFLDKNTGVFEQLNTSEREVLIGWENRIKTAPEKLTEATEKYFFLEDVPKLIAEGEKTMQLVDQYNTAKRNIQGDQTVYFAKEKKDIEIALKKMRAIPSVNSVSISDYSGGSMRVDTPPLMWVYDKFEAVLKAENISADIIEPVSWDCRQPFCFVNNYYGVVLWNGKTWAWTHQKCPYIIRYEYDATRKVFQQYNDPSKKAPALTDWQLKENGIQAVIVGQRDPKPATPTVTFWNMKGNLPPPLALLVPIFYAVQPIVKAMK